MSIAFLGRLSSVCSPLARRAGAAMHGRGAVELTDVTETNATARVRALELAYVVSVEQFDDGARATWRCACRPIAPSPGCPHVFATALALDELIGGIDAVKAAGGGNATVARRPEARVPRWRQRLEFLAASPPPTAAVVAPHIEYYVEWRSGDDRATLRILVRERIRKKNGELGGPRASRLMADDVALLPRADQLLLRQMQAGVRRWSYSYYPSRDDMVSLNVAWDVARHEVAPLLPLLAATRRVFQAPVPFADELSQPLRIDVAEPFSFVVDTRSVPASRAGHRMVVGKLARGAEAFVPRGVSVRDHDFVQIDDRLIAIECHGAQRLATELATKGPIEVPEKDLPALLAMLARAPGAARFLDAELAHVPAATPTGVVKFTFPRAPKADLRATLHYEYDGVLLSATHESPVVDVDGGVRRRDAATERSVLDQVAAAGLAATGHGELGCDRDAFAAVSARLLAAGVRVLAEGKPLRALRTGHGSLRSGIDWLEVEGTFAFDGKDATLPELLRHKVTPEGFVELDDGSLGVLPSTWLRRVEALRLLGGDAMDGVVRLPNSQALLLDALLAARDDEAEFSVDERFRALRARLEAFTRVQAATEPRSFRGELRPYQRDGLGWLQFLREFGLGGCLADDMGLGKTVQVLALLLAVHTADAGAAPARAGRRPAARGDALARSPSLLVAPRSVLGNWLEELRRFAPSLRVVDFGGVDRWRDGTDGRLATADLVLTTYALVRADAAAFAERELRFHYAILDEAQAIKNADSLSSKAVRLLRAEHRLVLTGTPVENHLGDLWSLFEFLNPGMLGRLPAFRALFGKDASAEAMATHREMVQRALRPVLLRRTKAQVLSDLPDKVEQTLWCEMAPPQRRRYDQLREHYKKRLLAGPGELDEKARFIVLEALLRLRQAACHEGLLAGKAKGAESAKFEELLPRLEELAAEGHKALVFSQFTSLLDLLEPRLRERGIVWERLDGSTTKRPQRIERFQSDAKCPLFLISLKAGGYGLNLTAASYVFLLDPWWNPAVEMQAIDRAHRIGQRRTVNAYRLVCRGTVEERVLELQAQKRALCEAILGNERSLLQDLTRADLELLLG